MSDVTSVAFHLEAGEPGAGAVEDETTNNTSRDDEKAETERVASADSEKPIDLSFPRVTSDDAPSLEHDQGTRKACSIDSTHLHWLPPPSQQL